MSGLGDRITLTSDFAGRVGGTNSGVVIRSTFLTGVETISDLTSATTLGFSGDLALTLQAESLEAGAVAAFDRVTVQALYGATVTTLADGLAGTASNVGTMTAVSFIDSQTTVTRADGSTGSGAVAAGVAINLDTAPALGPWRRKTRPRFGP